MSTPHQDPDGWQMGDKVRIRTGPNYGRRGVIRASIGDTVQIEVDDGQALHLTPEEITNYSLAARRAWQAMPKRAGRPRLPTPRKKMVSLRLDIEVWRMLSQAAEFGLIPSREQAINEWLRDRLVDLLESAPDKLRADMEVLNADD